MINLYKLLKERRKKRAKRNQTWESLSRDAIGTAQEQSLLSFQEAAYLKKMLDTREAVRIFCPPTKHQFYTRGLGYRRSCDDKPIGCYVLASFRCQGGGGYVVTTKPDLHIIQVQSFHAEEEK